LALAQLAEEGFNGVVVVARDAAEARQDQQACAGKAIELHPPDARDLERQLLARERGGDGPAPPADDLEHGVAVERLDQLLALRQRDHDLGARVVARGVEAIVLGKRVQLVAREALRGCRAGHSRLRRRGSGRLRRTIRASASRSLVALRGEGLRRRSGRRGGGWGPGAGLVSGLRHVWWRRGSPSVAPVAACRTRSGGPRTAA